MEGARELIADLGSRVDSVVLASSAKQHEVDRYLDLLDARELVDAWTTSADVEETKPEPDLVHAALDRAGADDGPDDRRHDLGLRGGGKGRRGDRGRC